MTDHRFRAINTAKKWHGNKIVSLLINAQGSLIMQVHETKVFYKGLGIYLDTAVTKGILVFLNLGHVFTQFCCVYNP